MKKVSIIVSRYVAKIVETKVKTETIEIEVPDNATVEEIEDAGCEYAVSQDTGGRINGVTNVTYFDEIVTNREHYMALAENAEDFEVTADAFYRQTGFMRNGKNDARGIHTRGQRDFAFMDWLNSPFMSAIV